MTNNNGQFFFTRTQNNNKYLSIIDRYLPPTYVFFGNTYTIWFLLSKSLLIIRLLLCKYITTGMSIQVPCTMIECWNRMANPETWLLHCETVLCMCCNHHTRNHRAPTAAKMNNIIYCMCCIYYYSNVSYFIKTIITKETKLEEYLRKKIYRSRFRKNYSII